MCMKINSPIPHDDRVSTKTFRVTEDIEDIIKQIKKIRPKAKIEYIVTTIAFDSRPYIDYDHRGWSLNGYQINANQPYNMSREAYKEIQ